MGSFVVTGAGLVTAAGDTPQAVLAAVHARKPLASIRADDGLVAAGIEDFDAKRYIARKGTKDLSRTSQLVCSAAAANAKGIEGVAPDEVGVVLGSAWGSLSTVIEFEREAHLQGARFVDPILFTETVSNVPAGQVAILYGWSAFNATVSSGSASGLAGLRQALAFLEEGRGSVAVAGGGDELNLHLLRALRLRGQLTERMGSLPFAPHASGPPGGEGACFLTIEAEEEARRRGASPIASVRASASRFVPGVAKDAAEARASLGHLIRGLVSLAGLALREVDLVVVSAGGSREGDAEEAGALLDVLGEGDGAAPVMAPKSILGETWGASGAIACVLAIEALRSGTVPAWPLGFVPAPEFAGLHLPREPLRRSMRNALIVDRTDSGHQIGLIVSLMEPHGARH